MSVSSELALAAAAAIGDHALAQQTKELGQLRKWLHDSQEVEVTGKLGRPVYGRGSFQLGDFREGVGLSPPGVLWEVKISNDEAFEAGIPLRKFRPGEMEIRLGGVVFATTEAVLGTNCRVRGAAANVDRDDVFCPILSGDKFRKYNRMAWMAINFRQLPEGPWRHLQSCAMMNSRVALDDREDIFHKISNPTDIPTRTTLRADVTSICFHASSVLKLIRTVRRDAQFESEKDTKLQEIEDLIASTE